MVNKLTPEQFIFISKIPKATLNLGRRVGERLEIGSVIALVGELGCGKTIFTRGICIGLGVSERQISSPTFAFVNEYRGRLPVFHIDLYRLNSISEGFEIGILDYFGRAEAGVLIVEWAEKILDVLPAEYLRVDFEVLSARQRQLKFTAFGEKFSRLLGELAKK